MSPLNEDMGILQKELAGYAGALTDKAFIPENTRGRKRNSIDEDPDLFLCSVMDPLDVDLYKLFNSKMIRRSNYQTQVFINRHNNPYLRTRRIHSMEITSVGVLISSILGLNVKLTNIGGEGHDCGHVVMGHLGERFFSDKLKKDFGCTKDFRHETWVCIVSEFIERYNKIKRLNYGLNMSYESLECWKMHSRGKGSFSLSSNTTEEAIVIMYSDKTYLFGDSNDLLRKQYFDKEPAAIREFGYNQRERVINYVIAVVKESAEAGRVIFEKSKEAQLFLEIKELMYKKYDEINENEGKYYYTMLDKVYNGIRSSIELGDYNPILLMALMVEDDIRKLVEISKITKEDILSTSLGDIMKNIDAIDNNINLVEFDLDQYIK